MDTGNIFSIIQESLFFIFVFLGFLGYALWFGRQAIINLILALYFALLISLKFPYYHLAPGGESATGSAPMAIGIFVAFTIFGTLLFGRLIPYGSDEPAFDVFGSKLVFAFMGAILSMAFSYHVLPVTDLITPGTPIHTLFAPEQHFFWWLMLPLVALFFL